ncbi:hypothetical protein HXX76_011242 [Chlamydomonas incerta]|uniref:Uncharacterized protein n=1 Tax=Chlamydomonas incerta TaxID=51695 RepID=A0A835VX10_CHLIN|nr:hypothetical protein HXX76_011242 [Chlamydomonas incerta]|eukprot:KAG2428998.1 hypothetical protein HXX76_011242 [Chlamydomonas incerta]
MEQIESTTQELGAVSERLRSVEAQRLAAVRDAETLRARVTHLEGLAADLQAGLRQKEDELETVQFTAHESQADASRAAQQEGKLRQAAAQAEEHALAAVAALDEAKAEAAKAHALAERHQQVVAKLTADNLMFLMQLKKAEADLATANQERSQLRLAAEHQRGPWFDQVRAGVEERVKHAMQRSVELEARLERQAAEHAQQLAELEQRRQDLAAELAAVRGQADDLQHRLTGAEEGQSSADKRCAAAESVAAELRQRLEDLSAENRVLQESVKAMRQECTERWVSEQAALGRVGGLDERIAALEAALSQQAAAAAALQRQLDTQVGVNRQLMSRKEEVEWQLMAAMAKVDGGAADGPVPLNLLVSGMLQVGGGQTQQQQQPPPQQQQQQQDPVQRASAAAAPPPAAAVQRAPAPLASVAGQSDHASASATGNVGAASQTSQPTAAAADSTTHSQQPRLSSPVGGHGTAAGTFAAASDAQGPAASEPAQTPMMPSTAFAAAAANSVAPSAASARVAVPQPRAAPAPAAAAAAVHATHPAAAEVAAGAQNPGAASLLHPEPTLALHDSDFDMFSLAPPAAYARHTQAAAGQRSVSGLSTGGGAASDTNARWASVEAASTVLSSPPSSVAISTEPGSPPAEVGPYRPPASSGQPAAARAPLTIRTGPISSVAGGSAVALASEAQQAAAPAYVLERRGSLHDGGDIWIGDAVSPTSSDSSDYLGGGGGIMVQRATHGAPSGATGGALTAALRGSDDGDRAGVNASRAVLQQLQEQLQIHLIAPSIAQRDSSAAPVTSAALTAQAAATVAAAPVDDWRPRGPAEAAPMDWARSSQARAPAAPAPDKDADFIRSRPTTTTTAGGGGGGGFTVGTRSTFSIRTTTAAPAPSAAAAAGFPALPSMHSGSDPAAGVFSIMRSSAATASRLAAAGSPKHPAFASSASPSTSAVTPAPPQPPPSTRAAVAASTTATAAAAPVDPPVPSRVQQGPVYHATAGALSGDAVADIKRWSTGGEGATHTSGAATGVTGPARAAPAGASGGQQGARLEPRESPSRGAEPAPPSPAYSRGSLSSPRSPPHPAFVVRTAVQPAAAAAGLGAASTPAASSAGSGQAYALSAAMTASAAATAAAANDRAAAELSGAPRPRVSFQGLGPGGDAGGEGARGAPGGGGLSTQASFTSNQSVPLSHRSGSVKSVRFTEDGDVADTNQERRSQDFGSAWGNPSASTRQPAAAQRVSPPPYKSQGALQHPALVIASPAKSNEAAVSGSAVERPTAGADAAAPAAKRYSAAGVAVTAAVPRGQLQQ